MLVQSTREMWRFKPEKMQKVGIFETDRFFCDVYCLEPGQSQPLHSHPTSDKMYCVVQGEGRFHVGGEEQVLRPGEMVVASPTVEHGVFNDSQDRLVVLVFMSPNPNVAEGQHARKPAADEAPTRPEVIKKGY
jgi:quercetin dioxygenase-like cupin family protein